jgi:hypothetical protein
VSKCSTRIRPISRSVVRGPSESLSILNVILVWPALHAYTECNNSAICNLLNRGALATSAKPICWHLLKVGPG